MKNKIDITSKKFQRRSRIAFSITSACVTAFTILIVVIVENIFTELNVFDKNQSGGWWFVTLIAVAFASAIIGAFATYIAGKIIFRPINQLIVGMEKLSKGQYDTRIKVDETKPINAIYVKFNNLAKELEGVSILRSDFINNFSHEFKTPIVSIKGLLSLLKSKDLPKEKQKEYIGVIEEELQRLSLMTTNVLSLTKLEKQEILTETKNYNLSEQIRTAILLFEKSWQDKNLNLVLDFDEYYVTANEDLLKQVWVNLIDNAIKYNKVGGLLEIKIKQTEKDIIVQVINEGCLIPDADKENIFKKFYRLNDYGGNGIGLSMVEKILSLHKGKVEYSVIEDKNCFTVTLPIIN